MEKTVVATQNAPAAIGPYSQGISVGNLVYTSGQMPLNPQTKVMETEISAASKQVMENVKAILEQAGVTMADVIKTTCFLKNMDDFAAFNAVYATYFPENPPARSCIQAAKLPMDVIVEVEAVAYRK